MLSTVTVEQVTAQTTIRLGFLLAKKSAASKGYRKTVKKKPFLTTKEIIVLVAIVVAIIAAVVLFNLFYGSGYLKARDVKPDDVVTSVSQDMRTRFVKVADAYELPGFTRTGLYRDTNPASGFTYTPDEPIDSISMIRLGGSFENAAKLADNNPAALQGMSVSGEFVYTDIYETTVQGCDAYIYGYTNDYYQKPQDGDAEDVEVETDEDGNPKSNVFYQSLNLYVSLAENRTIAFHIYRVGEDDSFYLPDDEIADYILGYASEAFSVYAEPEA